MDRSEPRYVGLHLLAFGTATALALGFAAGCGNQPVSDSTISESVAQRLDEEPTLASFEIEVETENGIVTIDGRVAGEAQRAEAERIARSTAGVEGVTNLIEVGGSLRPMTTPPAVGAPPARDRETELR